MFMRLVQVKVKPESFDELRSVYEERIIPELEKVEGCLFASLVQSAHQPDECISLTMWDSVDAAEAYVRDGTYGRLLDEVLIHLVNTTEWKVQLSADQTLEYVPVKEEPDVKGYEISQTQQAVPPSENPGSLYVRVLSLKFQQGKLEEFKEIYEREILPILSKTMGCRYVYLTGDSGKGDSALSMTIWDSKEHADEYESNGTFDLLVSKIKHLLAGLYQWKMSLGRELGRNTLTSEDISVEGYRVITGKTFM